MNQTIKTWLHNAVHALADQGITSAKIDAELILAHVLGVQREYLIAHSLDPLPSNDQQRADALLEQRKKHAPIAYLLGRKEFYGLLLKTDARALIPRGETETLVATALEWLKTHPQGRNIVEIGTGSGAITLALATHAPQHHYFATDASQAALDLARENATQLELDGITFLHGNLTEPVENHSTAHPINLLTANLPYIPRPLLDALATNIIEYEPLLALDGGNDGLNLYRQLFARLTSLMAPEGLILCEHEHDQSEAMCAIARQHFPSAEIKTVPDSLGQDRVLFCRLK